MTTGNRSPVRRRQLGRQLRLLRERAGLTLEEAAPALDWSASKLSRIETAQQVVDVHGLRSMLDLYQVGDGWAELTELVREARRRGWWRAYGLGDDSYIGFEAGAGRVTEFALTSVPGLLQTQGYSRALFTGSLVRRTRAERQNLVAVRAIRQQRLAASSDNPVELETVIDESVLHRPCGGPKVFAEQLRHLVTAAELPSVTLQVLPTGVGADLPITSGFIVLDFGDLDEPDIAYAEHSLGAALTQSKSEVTRSRLLFDRLRSLALGPADSVEKIRQLAERH
jgi:transcriptional regulator with XRE-family HTH domain